MKTVKALAKQLFGAKYESFGKSLLVAIILFFAVYAAEWQLTIAPFILYLTSTCFTAGIMWQMLNGRRHLEAMQGLLMLPFANRCFFLCGGRGSAYPDDENAVDLGAVLCCRCLERF